VFNWRDTGNVTDVRNLGNGLTVHSLLWKKKEIEKQENERKKKWPQFKNILL